MQFDDRTGGGVVRAAATSSTATYPFIFTDESGVVATSITQPYYGIGMLKITDVGPWVDELNKLVDFYISTVAKAGVKRARATYEFHFSNLTSGTRSFYEDLIDFYLKRPEAYFCALIIDKKQPDIDPIAVCGTQWDALITYSNTLLQTNIKDSERAVIISDYYQKPRKSIKYYERELAAKLGSKVANVVMMDSAASIMLQLVDVLLGCVMYHYKLPTLTGAHADKKALADKVAAAYGVTTLAQKMTKKHPNYFSVWPFKPKGPPAVLATPAP